MIRIPKEGNNTTDIIILPYHNLENPFINRAGAGSPIPRPPPPPRCESLFLTIFLRSVKKIYPISSLPPSSALRTILEELNHDITTLGWHYQILSPVCVFPCLVDAPLTSLSKEGPVRIAVIGGTGISALEAEGFTVL